jgi:hypothetical protein
MSESDETTPVQRKKAKPQGPTCDVPVAGYYYFGFNRAQSYEAVKKGVIPVIRIGKRQKAIVAKLDKMVEG